MHVTHLDNQIITNRFVLSPAIPNKEYRNLVRATGAPGRRSEQRQYSADS